MSELNLETAPKLSIVIPVFNEQECLPELLRRCRAAGEACGLSYEVVLVDDGSRDRSRALIEEASQQFPGVIIGVLLNRNYGQHAAVMAGFEHCRGEFVVTLDADLQNPPEEIPRIVRELAGGADVVGTVRQNRQDSAFRRMSSALVNRVVQKSTGVLMHDYGCMLRGYRREIVEAMRQCRERSTFIPILANSFARSTAEIEVSHAQRAVGDSKYSVWKLINLQFDLLTGMTTFPLRLLSLVGTLISLAGMGFGLFLLIMRLCYGAEWAVHGVFTLFAILFIFVGAQFIAMGLLGEYLGRMYYDVRARPRYFVHKITGRPAALSKPS